MSERAEKSALAAYRARLGKVPDQQIADLAGVSRTLVVNYRKKLNIPAYQGHKADAVAVPAASEDRRPFRGRRSALDPYASMLGRVPDSEVARLAGVTAENVRTYRQRRNIAATWQDGVAPGEVVATEPSAPARDTSPTKRPASRAPKAAAEPAGTTPAPVPTAQAAAPQAAPPALTGGSGTTAFLVIVEADGGPHHYALVSADIATAAAIATANVPSRHPNGVIRTIQRVAELLPR